MKPIKKILIANRGEIALRLQATYHACGLKTVAVFSPEDRNASFVASACVAYPLSLSGTAAYFNQDEMIAIALQAGADAIAPGYGFLSEKADFAQKVIDAGLCWVGPAPAYITLMANKIKSRELASAAGVPVVPGFMVHDRSEQGKAEAKVKAEALGYPLIIKDPQSGGGKAMRRVGCADEFDAAWDAVIAEGRWLTSSNALLIERYLIHGRHVEVQVAGDGKVFVHLFERECSIQRRHQKIIEETPCAFVSQPTLERMYQAAVMVATAVGYNSIGTVEFMVTPDEEFYFLEMNTRLQVEHAVTEMTTGIDLVALQLDLARIGSLPLRQHDIVRRGHAIECRLYAEDPTQRFIPSTGTIVHLSLPNGPFVRLEHDLAQGQAITPFFDPMIAKVVTFNIDRPACINHMLAVLEAMRIEGIVTNRQFLIEVMRSAEFVSGAFHTQLLADAGFMTRMLDALSLPKADDQRFALLAGVAVVIAEHERQKQTAQLTEQPSADGGGRYNGRRWKDQQWR